MLQFVWKGEINGQSATFYGTVDGGDVCNSQHKVCREPQADKQSENNKNNNFMYWSLLCNIDELDYRI